MKKKVSVLLIVMFVMVMTTVVLAEYYPYYIGTNNKNYGYSPVGGRTVMVAAGSATAAYTQTQYQNNPNHPIYQYLYAYVAKRSYETVISNKITYGSKTRGYAVRTQDLTRDYTEADINFYHISKCYNYQSYTTNPAVGMVNLFEENYVRVNQYQS